MEDLSPVERALRNADRCDDQVRGLRLDLSRIADGRGWRAVQIRRKIGVLHRSARAWRTRAHLLSLAGDR